MNTLKRNLKLILLATILLAGNCYAALPIAECKTFLDEALELLCLKSSIEARIEDEIPYNNRMKTLDYDSDDVEFLSNRLISLSPNGSVNYDIHFAGQKSVSHLDNPFMQRVLGGEIISYDDPASTTYEMKYIVIYGKAYVSLRKRNFD